MRRFLLTAALCLAPFSVLAQDHSAAIDAALETHVLPGNANLASASAFLSDTAQTHCVPTAPELRAAYHAAFDAWLHVSHLRFGPFETENLSLIHI